MNLGKYISELLYSYECVIVPNFGGFLTKEHQAVLDELSGTITPPTKKISFNINIKQSDGLLINYISRQRGISYSDASAGVNLEVENWRNNLDKIKSLSIENIGTFKLSTGGNLVFTPDDSFNYLINSFGLGPIHAPRINRNLEKAITLKTNNLNRRLSYSLKKPMRYVAGLILGGSLLIGPFIYQQNDIITYFASVINIGNHKKNQSSSVVSGIEQESEEISEEKNYNHNTYSSDKKNQSSSAASDVEQENAEISEEKKYNHNTYSSDKVEKIIIPEKREISKKENTFFIISGSFKKIANAQKCIREINKKGFDSKLLRLEGSNIRVYYSSFNDIDTAKLKLSKIREINPEAWILKVKNRDIDTY
ncbi:HU domain-containing protein [Ichthyobacterium seriolicida]|uniref:Sporulation domain-containing protein n=1 Tax=Ichthyobacterium seriolicida TaxID=242600 RepID=A0A1J1E360_9FLAO|nr:SPOR domain-containing protein [Ichthyobacterium seriolicida]BAV94468.1 sporulation domain-containing protein [Ichthyobacterium seriolicida]